VIKEDREMKKPITLTFDEETLEELDRLGEKMGLTRSATVNMLLRGVLFNEKLSVVKVMMAVVKESRKKGKEKPEELVTA
jgi:antitoxin component of RelBE/YafQ-DinJ toxin-antitoxin module